VKWLIRLALILAGSAAWPACLRAQTAGGAFAAPAAPAALSSNSLGPRIQFNIETCQAGTNFAGDPIHHDFLVTNTGDEMLVLSDVKPGCPCTTVGGTTPGSATTWTHLIAPGQTGVVPILVDTSNLRGPIDKAVTVNSNDRKRPAVALQIIGFVTLPIEISPQPSAYFSIVPGSTNRSVQVLKIVNRMDAPLSLSDPQSTNNAFSAVLKTNVPGREFELTVTAAPPAPLNGSLSLTTVQGQISLKSSATNKNPLTIPVYETVSPEITIFPLNIQLPVGSLTQPLTSHVSIRDNIADFTLTDAAVNVPGVNVSTIMMQTNRIYVLTVTFPQGFAIQPGQGAALTVKTDNPRFPLLTIPVTSVPGMAQPARPGQFGAPPADAAALARARLQPGQPPVPAPVQPNRTIPEPLGPPARFAAPANPTNAPQP